MTLFLKKTEFKGKVKQEAIKCFCVTLCTMAKVPFGILRMISIKSDKNTHMYTCCHVYQLYVSE